MNNKPVHELMHPLLTDWPELKGLDHTDDLSRMHMELLHVIASKRNLDLFDVASLMNIGHVSAAEMVDSLIEKGLVETGPVSNQIVKVKLTPKISRHLVHTSGFTPIKKIIRENKNSKYGLLSDKALRKGR